MTLTLLACSAVAQNVVIIGGGLSGSLLALQLLRDGAPWPRITLVDRAGAFGRGIAYATDDAAHLLNVPAARMSAYADRPKHFLQWLKRHHAAAAPADYLPRGVYGSYIRGQLDAAIADGLSLELVEGEVTDIEPDGWGARVHIADRRTVTAGTVVVATGSPAGSPPPALPADPRVFTDPWAPAAVRSHPPGHHTLVIGSGLTAIDVALATTRLGASVTAVSRHGLLPEQHLPGLHLPVAPPSLPRGELTLAEMERFVTAHIDAARRAGRDWRDAFDGLRPHVPQLWATLSPGARREFLASRVRLWDVCRHRMPPASAEQVATLRANGQLRVLSGTVGAVSASAEGLQIDGSGWTVRADRVICCTGAGPDVRANALVARLIERGLATSDELSLGLRADAFGALLDRSGLAQPWLRTLGPLRRGELWETTAAEEIRAQATTLAHTILAPAAAAAA